MAKFSRNPDELSNGLFLIVGERVEIRGQALFKPRGEGSIFHIKIPGRSCQIEDFSVKWVRVNTLNTLEITNRQEPGEARVRAEKIQRFSEVCLTDKLVLSVQMEYADARVFISRSSRRIECQDRTYFLVAAGAPEWSHAHGGIVARVHDEGTAPNFVAVPPNTEPFVFYGCTISRHGEDVGVTYPDGTRYYLYALDTPCMHRGLTIMLFDTLEDARSAIRPA